MDTWHYAAIGGFAGLISYFVATKRGKRDALDVLPVLRERGPSTIPEIMTALGKKGFSAQGNIVFALNSLIQQGVVEELPVPPGTKQLDKIKKRQYRLKQTSTST